MTVIAVTKPAVRPVWGVDMDPGYMIDPDTVTANYVANGWPLSSVPPSRQYFNFLINYLWNGVAYFSRRGITDWDANQTYSIYDVAIATNGVVYQSLQGQNTGNQPQSSPSYWGGLQGYALTGVLGGYVTNSELTAALANYPTNTQLSQDLSNYVTNAALATSLSAYLTTGSFNSTIANYATTAALNASVVSTESYVNAVLANYVTNSAYTVGINSLTTSLDALTTSLDAQIAIALGSFSNGGLQGISSLKFGNGLEMRFGAISPVVGTQSVSFPPFTTSPLWAIAVGTGGTAYQEGFGGDSIIIYSSVANLDVYWMALGY